jgi:hypothetical protein
MAVGEQLVEESWNHLEPNTKPILSLTQEGRYLLGRER